MPSAAENHMYVMVNKQVKFLTSQYVGTRRSANTKGDALN